MRNGQKKLQGSNQKQHIFWNEQENNDLLICHIQTLIATTPMLT